MLWPASDAPGSAPPPATFPRLDAVGRRIASRRWFQALARWGLLVKGVIFLMIGSLAGLAALDLGGDFINAYGVMQKIATHLFGILLLIVVMTGNFGYALFKLVAAVFDTDRKGSNAIGLLKRLSMLIKSLLYIGLGFLALQVLFGLPGGDGSGDTLAKSIAAKLSRHVFGQWMVVLLGVYLVLMGFVQFYMIYTAYIGRRLAIDEISRGLYRTILTLARLGYAARGVVAIVTGGFVCIAGWYNDPSSARGLGGALKWLGEQAYIPYLLGAVAAGLCSYGVFEILLARYRRILMPSRRTMFAPRGGLPGP
ncbi:MAG: DUF1206 domain-containing protein [Planctomycetes bacterium]|nr:DUF1206 domain-containing protein [Planctomycetota bacterium]